MTAKAALSPTVRGWCPGAHRPMMSGDGLVVRVRPFRATLSPEQTRTLCDLAQRFGNGMLDLTSRANLQFRAVSDANYPELLHALKQLNLLDENPSVEGRRNILIAPDWEPGGLTDRLYAALLKVLPDLSDLPEKMGYALDTGAQGCLSGGSADFRFELDAADGLLLRADGAVTGTRIDEDNAMSKLTEMVTWFVETGGKKAGRMARHLRNTPIPEFWQGVEPRTPTAELAPGPTRDGVILGVPFGSISADALRNLTVSSRFTELRLMTGRLVWLRGATVKMAPGFVAAPGSALLTAHACPGAPFCPQATVETRALAERLAGRVDGTLHVSGCSKGCALPRHADFTLVGRVGRFDLVRNGAPWDEPEASGLLPEHIVDLTGTL